MKSFMSGFLGGVVAAGCIFTSIYHLSKYEEKHNVVEKTTYTKESHIKQIGNELELYIKDVSGVKNDDIVKLKKDIADSLECSLVNIEKGTQKCRAEIEFKDYIITVSSYDIDGKQLLINYNAMINQQMMMTEFAKYMKEQMDNIQPTNTEIDLSQNEDFVTIMEAINDKLETLEEEIEQIKERK